jgi:hypothetical protein
MLRHCLVLNATFVFFLLLFLVGGGAWASTAAGGRQWAGADGNDQRVDGSDGNCLGADIDDGDRSDSGRDGNVNFLHE